MQRVTISNPTLLNVSAVGNVSAVVPVVESRAGFAGMVARRPSPTNLQASSERRMKVAWSKLLFYDLFKSALRSTSWIITNTTFASAVPNNGTLRINTALTNGTGTSVLQSRKTFSVSAADRLWLRVPLNSWVASSNRYIRVGFLFNTGTPGDGVFFESLGEALVCTLRQNSISFRKAATLSETVDHPLVLEVAVTCCDAQFWVNGVLVATLSAGNLATSISSQDMPVQIYVQNLATTATPLTAVDVGPVFVWLEGTEQNKPSGHRAAGMGNPAYEALAGTGQSANYANSANPTAAAPTNTTAALGSGLGGQFWETDTLAVNTDGIISSFQLTPYALSNRGLNLFITGVRVDSFVQTALTGGGYAAQWCVAYGHTSVSLATGEGASTKAPRRIPLGVQQVDAGVLAGVALRSLSLDLTQAPIMLQPGEFIQTVKKKVGTAPSAGVIAHTVAFTGYWE